ncbi:hypothetical protein PVMG_01979 [Plasmodium vivax Mauritania I]|uniref:Regulator of chromosome condensation n=1 Tax=Plasmodium vivax Mauritania I TaxID=1035515 RepID=A0A0J9W310_PLAVI|nr:hypothetical protein PVMG_01979 [Plasmodium vivax Mauritania I]
MKRRNINSSFYNSQSYNTLRRNEIYNDILTRLPNDFSISTIKKIKIDEQVGKSMSKGDVHDLLGKRRTESGGGRRRRSVTSEEGKDKNKQNGKRVVKEEPHGKLLLHRRRSSTCNRAGNTRVNPSRDTNYLTRNRYEEGAVEKKKRFFSENEKDKDYQRRIRQYSDFFKTGEYVAGGSGGQAGTPRQVAVRSQLEVLKREEVLKRGDVPNQADVPNQVNTSNSPNSNSHLADGGNKQGEDHLFFNPEIINCGKYHSGVVSKNGFVCLWGLNCYGQLGVNPNKSVHTCYRRTKLKTLKRDLEDEHNAEEEKKKRKKKKKKDAAARRTIFSPIKKEKTVLSPYIHKLVPLKHFGHKHKVKDISLGSFHTLLLTYDGFVFTFGCNKKAQLGLPNGYHRKVSHTSRPFLLPLVIVERGMQKSHPRYGRTNTFFFSSKTTYANIAHPVISINCGAYNSAVIDANRKLWIWGWNKFGQIDNSYAVEKMKKKEREEEAHVCKTCSGGRIHVGMMNLKRISEMVQRGGEHIKKKLTSKERLHVKGEDGHKDKRGRHKKSNKLVNVPRNVKIKDKSVLQVSLGKYHSLCLTEDKSVYIWGYLKRKKGKKKGGGAGGSDGEAEAEAGAYGDGGGKKCSYVLPCCGGGEYYRNITRVTKISCLSHLYISSIASSSTHTAFVAPITYIDERSVGERSTGERGVDSRGGPRSAISAGGGEKVGDKFRYNILLKNECSHLLKYYSEQVITRGGDNIFYVKYADLILLISGPPRGGEGDVTAQGIHPRDNVYLINNSLHVSNVYSHGSNYYLDFGGRGGRAAGQAEDSPGRGGYVSGVSGPLLLSNNNNLNRVDLLQIFQVAMGKNFAIFLTSSPSINRILNKKKIDYINNICSLDVLRNKIPERNLFIIGKSDFHHIILPSNCKQTSIPVCLHKNKLINEVLLRNKKHNFLNISRRKKHSDQISYHNKMLNLKHLHGKIKKSVTNCSLLYNDVDQQRFSLILDAAGANRSSLAAYKLNSANCGTSSSRNRKSISYVQSSSDRVSSSHGHSNGHSNSNSNRNSSSNRNNSNGNIFHFNLGQRRGTAARGKCASSEDRFSAAREGSSRVSSHVSSGRAESNQVSSHVSSGREESNPEQKDSLSSSSNEGDLKREDNPQSGAHLGMPSEKPHLYEEPGEYYPIGKAKQVSSAWGTPGEQLDHSQSTQNDGKHFSYKSSSRSSSSCNNYRASGQAVERDNQAVMGACSIVGGAKKEEMCGENANGKGDGEEKGREVGGENEKKDGQESGPPAKERRKSSTCVNKKKLFRNMILQAIDKINDNFLNQKNESGRLVDCEQVKLKFKVFKRRRSCLWNYFTYHHTKRKGPLGFNLSENIVNITLLDVACGDYHSLILLEVDTLT